MRVWVWVWVWVNGVGEGVSKGERVGRGEGKGGGEGGDVWGDESEMDAWVILSLTPQPNLRGVLPPAPRQVPSLVTG